MVNLQALEAALNKVERIRDHEFCFEVDGTKICLLPLRPDQETDVQKFAQVVMDTAEDGETTQAAFADFMDRMRHASLGFSIIQIGSLDLRGVEYIETGEQDDHGNNVSIPKWEAITEVVAREWSRMMLSQVFGKFGEMLDRMELRAQKAVNFEPVDLDEEIERTNRRLLDLQTAKDRIKAPTADQVTRQQKAVAEIDKAGEEVRNNIRSGNVPSRAQADEAPTPPQPPPAEQKEQKEPTPPQPPQERRSAVPQEAAPRQRPQEPEASEEPQKPQEFSPEQYVDERGIVLPNHGDSFFDPSDPEEAMRIETQRLAHLQQQQQAQKRAQAEQQRLREEAGMPSPEEHARQMQQAQRDAGRPKAVNLTSAGPALDSVRQAANLHNAVADAGAGSIQSGRPQRARPQPQSQPGSNQPAQLHGKPVYKMEPQTLERREAPRQHGEPAKGPMQMNPSGGARNPNFRPKGS